MELARGLGCQLGMATHEGEGNGGPVTLSYASDAKYLSTPIHHALAKQVRERGTGKRLAWLWVADQGAWISLLDDGGVESLNAALKLGSRARCEWGWVDETPPFASGDTVRP